MDAGAGSYEANACRQTVRIWDAKIAYPTSTDPFGQVQNETFGNGVSAYTEYDPASGWMLRLQAGAGGATGLRT